MLNTRPQRQPRPENRLPVRTLPPSRRPRITVRAVVFGIVSVWALLGLFPLYWLFDTALSSPQAFVSIPPRIVPFPWTWQNFVYLFHSAPIWRWFGNSLFVSTVVTLGNLVFDAMAAYAFSKGRFRGRDTLFWVVLSTMMIPAEATLVPQFFVMSRLHLLNTYWALILPALGRVWGVFLLRQYMQTLSTEFFDAARVDGAGEWTVFWKLVVPLSTPALGALGLLTFVANWNDFIWPLIALNSTQLFTLPVGLSTLQQQYYTNYGYVLAGGVITAIPTILIFLLGQRFFVRGLTTGGIKN